MTKKMLVNLVLHSQMFVLAAVSQRIPNSTLLSVKIGWYTEGEVSRNHSILLFDITALSIRHTYSIPTMSAREVALHLLFINKF